MVGFFKFIVVTFSEELLNCSPVDIVESVGEGWQKSVFRSATNYAIKKPRLDGPTFIECLERLSVGHRIPGHNFVAE